MKDSEIYPYVHHIEEEVKTISKIIKDLNSGKTYNFKAIPEFMQKLVDAGGLMNYAKSKI